MPTFEEYQFPNRPRRYREAPAVGRVLLIALFLIGGGLGLGYYAFRGHWAKPHDAEPREVTARGERDALERERIRVFKETSPSVVNVDTLRIQRSGYSGLTERQQGTGSGFVWDQSGRIVTNFHVVQDALQVSRSGDISIQQTATIRVTMADQTSRNARLVGVAPDFDLAVVQIDVPKEKLTPVTVGTSNDLDVGQTVYAIGNPFGRSLTFTHGIISALDREILSVTDRPIAGAIQTDAPLNPGNSGGPLLDREGRLIGVNTAITSPSGGNVGIGYAIPVDTVNPVVAQLIKNGRAARPAMGVVLLRERDTRALGVESGVLIAEVRPGSAAAKAGLQGFRANPASGRQEIGDRIIAIEGETISSLADYERVMGKMKILQTIRLTIVRAGREREIPVTLEGI